MNTITFTCSKECYGFKNYHGSCCKLENRDFIIGPIGDAAEVLTRLATHFNREVNYNDIFIDYEEGHRLFPNRSTWQNPSAYPALRVNLDSRDLNCIFYNSTVRACSIYTIRPQTCQKFYCDYLRKKIDNETLDTKSN